MNEHQAQHEPGIRSAVRAVAQAACAWQPVDWAPLAGLTSSLPLSGLDAWEAVIRAESGVAVQQMQRDQAARDQAKVWFRALLRTRPSVVPAPALTWLDLCSGDGRRRERVLRTLSGAAPNRFFLAIAVRRLNDWVPQVRQAARESLPAMVNHAEVGDAVDVLVQTLVVSRSWGRAQAEDRQTLIDLAGSSRMAPAIVARLMRATDGSMTPVLSLLSLSSVFDAYLAQIAAQAVQPHLRAKAYRCLLDGKVVSITGHRRVWTDIRYCISRREPITVERPLAVSVPWLPTFEAARGDRSSIVRRLAAEILIREIDRFGAKARTIAQAIADDPAGPVSERGRFALSVLKGTFCPE